MPLGTSLVPFARKGSKISSSMTNYYQHQAPDLTLLKQFDTASGTPPRGQNCGFNEGPYV
jgi:hypothetical protein